MNNAELIKTWKVQTTSTGVDITINGKTYRTHAGESFAFDVDRAAKGWNGHYESTPERTACAHGLEDCVACRRA